MQALPKTVAPQPVNNIRVKLVLLLLSVALILTLWALILQPFLPVVAWSLAITTMCFPIHRRIKHRLKNENLAAAISVLFVAIMIVAPTYFLLNEVVNVVAENADMVTSQIEKGTWKQKLLARPQLAPLTKWMDRNVGLQNSAREFLTQVKGWAPTVFANSFYSLLQLLLILFTCFYFFRDRSLVLGTLREFIPLARHESDEIFKRVEDTIHATVYGTLVVASIQGLLGGLMFWFLGLSAPLLWGMVMGMFALIPYLGTFVVWAPVATYLALAGEVSSALILALWGGIVVASIDNLLFPFLVGNRMRFHTLPVFFFILGGVTFFGASGIVLGPVALAIGNGAFEICKRKLANSET